MFMASEDLEYLVDDAWALPKQLIILVPRCKNGKCDNDLIERNKKICMPVDDTLHGKDKEIDDG